MNDHNIKILRLQTGQDIIADIEEYEDDNVVRLLNPMILYFKRSQVGSVMMISPWLPAELIEENIANISSDDVLSILSPKQKLIDYYQTMVNVHLASWLEKQQSVFDSLDLSAEDETEEEMNEEEENEEYSEELEYLKSNNLLH